MTQKIYKLITPFFLILYMLSFFYFILTFNINAFEYDTRVTLSLIESLLVDGKILMPFADASSFSFCNSENICTQTPDYSFGEHISSQLAANYTSGLIVILPTLLISKIISIFSETPQSIGYLIFLYSISMGLITSFSILLINFFSNFSLEKKFILWILPIPILCSLHIISGDRIVGEYIASILVSLSVFVLLISFNTKQKSSFYCFIALILGASFEAKSSVGVIILVAVLFLLYQSWLKEKSLLKVITYGFFAIFPKLLFYIYVWGTVNFSINGFMNYLTAYGKVARHNANSFLGWQVPNLYGESIFFHGNLEKYLITLLLLTTVSIIYLIVNKKYINLAIPFFSSIILLSALIYPTIFSAPYPRIFSPFWALLPACIFALILLFKQENQNKILKKIPLILIIFFCVEIFQHVKPLPSTMSLKSAMSWNLNKLNDINEIDRTFEKSYPNINLDDKKNFLISGFFAMPWDFYLGRRLSKEAMPRFHNGIHSEFPHVPENNYKLDTYYIYSCRWGHCNRENEFKYHLYIYNGGMEMFCKFIEPVKNKTNFIRLYSCK